MNFFYRDGYGIAKLVPVPPCCHPYEKPITVKDERFKAFFEERFRETTRFKIKLETIEFNSILLEDNMMLTSALSEYKILGRYVV